MDELQKFLKREQLESSPTLIETEKLFSSSKSNNIEQRSREVCSHMLEQDENTHIERLEDEKETDTEPEQDHRQKWAPAFLTRRKALLCLALTFVVGINAFLLKEVENWKRPYTALTPLFDPSCPPSDYLYEPPELPSEDWLRYQGMSTSRPIFCPGEC